MTRLTLFFLPLLLFHCGTPNLPARQGQPVGQAETDDSLQVRLEPFDESAARALFGDGLTIEVFAADLDWAEGPLELPDGTPICSDVPRNHIVTRGDQVWLDRSGDAPDDYSGEPGSNGLALDPQNRLLLCQHGARRVARLTSSFDDPEPRYETVADRYQGKRFNSPNDLVVAADGSVLFTDPIYGLPNQDPNHPSRELDFCGVFRVTPDGEVSLLSKEYSRPNGIGLSPDGKTLYVTDSDGEFKKVYASPILDDAFTLGPRRVLIDGKPLAETRPGSTDGLAVARNGRIFATVPGGVRIVAPDGKLIADLLTGRRTANCALGANEEYLYVTADDYFFRVKLNPAS